MKLRQVWNYHMEKDEEEEEKEEMEEKKLKCDACNKVVAFTAGEDDDFTNQL